MERDTDPEPKAAVWELFGAVEALNELIRRFDQLVEQQQSDGVKFDYKWPANIKIHHAETEAIIDLAQSVFKRYCTYYRDLLDQWPTPEKLWEKADRPGFKIEGEAELTRFQLSSIKLLLERCCRIVKGYAEGSSRNSSNPTYHFGDVNMGDVYNPTQAAAVGRNAVAKDNILNQANAFPDQEYLKMLSSDLRQLRNAMKLEATTVDHDAAVGQIANAESAIKKGDLGTLSQHLKSAGTWALDVATKIGVDVACDALKRAVGI
jgi:hypothetical protein